VAKLLEDTNRGIKINGEYINNIRYTDDTVVFVNILESFQEMMVRVVEVSQRYGLFLNFKKRVKNHKYQTERVQTYTYLGTMTSETWDHFLEINF